MPSLETSFFDRLSTRYAGGISVSGIALTFTGYAQAVSYTHLDVYKRQPQVFVFLYAL